MTTPMLTIEIETDDNTWEVYLRYGEDDGSWPLHVTQFGAIAANGYAQRLSDTLRAANVPHELHLID